MSRFFCPECAGEMTRHIGEHRSHYVCDDFPRCQGVRAVNGAVPAGKRDVLVERKRKEQAAGARGQQPGNDWPAMQLLPAEDPPADMAEPEPIDVTWGPRSPVMVGTDNPAPPPAEVVAVAVAVDEGEVDWREVTGARGRPAGRVAPSPARRLFLLALLVVVVAAIVAAGAIFTLC